MAHIQGDTSGVVNGIRRRNRDAGLCDRRFTADWAKDNERRAAGQRADQQRIADYYARTTKEQEDRENAEARERFLAQQRQLSVNRPPRL